MSTTMKVLCVGSYLANAVDENGCVVDSAFQVMAPDSILFDVVIEDVTCNGEANGSICVENATGGTGALSFQWTLPERPFNSTRALM